MDHNACKPKWWRAISETSTSREACLGSKTNWNRFTFFHTVIKLDVTHCHNIWDDVQGTELCILPLVRPSMLGPIDSSIDWVQYRRFFYLSSETESNIRNVVSNIMMLDNVQKSYDRINVPFRYYLYILLSRVLALCWENFGFRIY